MDIHQKHKINHYIDFVNLLSDSLIFNKLSGIRHLRDCLHQEINQERENSLN